MSKHFFTLFVAALWLPVFGQGTGPVLVKDIKPGSSGSCSNFQGFFPLGDRVIFGADNGTLGNELWVSDGIAAGTVLLKDIYPGTAGSKPTRFMGHNNQCFFYANDGTHGDELWATDGTPLGTKMVKDINPGAGHSIQRNSGPGPKPSAIYKDFLYFSADVGTEYGQLWRTNGTDAGTELVAKPCPSCTANSWGQYEFTHLGDQLYFLSQDIIWTTDGTATGTKALFLTEDRERPVNISNLFAWRGKIYLNGRSFFGFDTYLWETDGTKAGTVSIKSMPGSGNPRHFTDFNGQLFFVANQRLWATDGTAPGTRTFDSTLLTDEAFIWEKNILVWKNELYFAGKAADNRVYLYKTNGTLGNATKLYGANSGSFKNIGLVASPNRLFSVGTSPNDASIYGLAETDGTPGGSKYHNLNLRFGPTLGPPAIAGKNLFLVAATDDGFGGDEVFKFAISTVSTAPVSLDSGLRLLPTVAADGRFSLRFDPARARPLRLAVTDVMGNLRKTLFVPAADALLDLSDLPAGTYIISAREENGQNAGAWKVVSF